MTTKEEQEALYNKVRGLLRKAEGTDNEHEAAIFYEKAQEWIMRYAIDEEALWASDPAKRSKIETLDITIMDKTVGAQEKRRILHACAKANRCRMWYRPGSNTSTIAGFSSDLLFVEMLFSSILTQMNFKMAVGIATNPMIHHKTYKLSFIVGFSERIWDRFREATKRNTEKVESENPGMELVLADRSAKVDAWVAENYKIGRGSSQSRNNVNSRAYGQGATAANETDISGGRGTVTRSKQRELNQ